MHTTPLHDGSELQVVLVYRRTENMLSVEVHNNFESCEQELDGFLADNQVANPFARVEWLKTWWKHYGNGTTLQLLLVRRNTQLVGFAPLFSIMISKTRIREFRFLGHRKGNYLGFYAQAGMDRAVFDSVIDYLNKTRSPTILALTDVNSSSSFYEMLVAHDGPKRRGFHKYGLYPCPYAELDTDWETFFKKAISQGKKRTELRKFERKLSTLGVLEFETVKDLRHLHQVFPHMTEIHGSRFSRTINKALDDRNRQFLFDVCEAFLDSGLNLSVLTLSNIPISFVLGFETDKVFVDYIPAFNPVFSRFSVGHIHLMKLMRSLIEKGIAILDFSKGEEVYKRKWSTDETWNYLFLVHLNANILSSVFYVMKRIRTKVLLWIRESGHGKQIRQLMAGARSLLRAKEGKSKFTIDITNEKKESEESCEFSYECFCHLPGPVQQFLVEYRYDHSEQDLGLSCDSEDHATIIDQSGTVSTAEIAYNESHLWRVRL
jgi:CelD/BcsL family acetyltransferase involved in cellulose biosynthesis